MLKTLMFAVKIVALVIGLIIALQVIVILFIMVLFILCLLMGGGLPAPS